MATLRTWLRFEVVDGNDNVQAIGNSLYDAPVQVTVGGTVHRQTYSIADTGTQKIFDVTTDLSNFDFAIILSDQNLLLQKVIDDAGNNGEAFFVETIRANVPYPIPIDDGLAGNGTVDLFDGTADVIERLDVKNSSGATANVTVLVIS